MSDDEARPGVDRWQTATTTNGSVPITKATFGYEAAGPWFPFAVVNVKHLHTTYWRRPLRKKARK